MEPSQTRDVPQLVLASSSPARRSLLTELGINLQVKAMDVNETAHEGESPEDLVVRLALDKATAAARTLGITAKVGGVSPAKTQISAVVVGADTMATVDGSVLGKPDGDVMATEMLSMLSGRSHLIHTGVAVHTGGAFVTGLDTTEVWFRSLGADEINQYVAAGESQGRAGAYGIQGRASLFVDRIHGSFSGVVGLPLALVESLLVGLGQSLTNWMETTDARQVGGRGD